MIADVETIVLELSLVSSQPESLRGRDMIRAAAAVNALGCVALQLPVRELRTLEYTVSPLLILLDTDSSEPLAAKAAFGLRALMSSRVCMSRFLAEGGMAAVAKIFDELLSPDVELDMHSSSNEKIILENLCTLYKDTSLYHPWDIVRVGGIRHCVTILRRGSVDLQTQAVGALAAMSVDEQICKQMFREGATKPVLNVSDADVTNEPCMLAGLGCITQLARIPEVGLKIAKQGVAKVLEKALQRKEGVSPLVVREKAVYALAYLSRIPAVRKVLATPTMRQGLMDQLFHGTFYAKCTVVMILTNLHGAYDRNEEIEMMRTARDGILGLLKEGQWTNKNILIKSVCVLYRHDDDKMYLVEHGLLEMIYDIMEEKPEDLMEACMVLLLSLCTHPDIPWIVMDAGGLPIISRILHYLEVPVIIELTKVLLKILSLYDRDRVDAALDAEIPVEKPFLRNLDSPECTLFGSEYGGLILEYVQNIVQTRRKQHYLLVQFQDEELANLGISQLLMEAYENAFMELDLNCRGFLEIDALKVIMVLKGEKLDDDELIDIFNEYDTERTGRMFFWQFVDLMSGWKNRFGTGTDAIVNKVTKSGMIGRARRMFLRWYNRDKMDEAEIARIRQKKDEERHRTAELAATFMQGVAMSNKRERALQIRPER